MSKKTTPRPKPRRRQDREGRRPASGQEGRQGPVLARPQGRRRGAGAVRHEEGSARRQGAAHRRPTRRRRSPPRRRRPRSPRTRRSSAHRRGGAGPGQQQGADELQGDDRGDGEEGPVDQPRRQDAARHALQRDHPRDRRQGERGPVREDGAGQVRGEVGDPNATSSPKTPGDGRLSRWLGNGGRLRPGPRRGQRGRYVRAEQGESIRARFACILTSRTRECTPFVNS